MKFKTAAAPLGLALLVVAYSHTTTDSVANVEAAPGPASVNDQLTDPGGRATATKAFLDRVHEYVTFQNRVSKTVPAITETSDPVQVAKRQATLAEAIIKQRGKAVEGDFLIERYQPYLRQIVRQDFSKRPLADRRALIVELPKGLNIGVNMVYPTTLPLATFPGNLLKVLPELPQVLEYRIVGRHLVLRDAEANVIVDVMRDVFPIPA